jgi:NTE family protein
MRAFVLSGGSIKGAFQAGAIAHTLRSGFRPELVSGISVGALNGAFLADRAGQAAARGEAPDWTAIADGLESFWLERIQGPSALVQKKREDRLIGDILGGTFSGFVHTTALRQLIEAEVDPANVLRSPIRLMVGAVNMRTGQLAYTDTADAAYRAAGLPDLHARILASTAIPVAMPPVEIDGDTHYDGGIREIAPVGTAVNAGGTDLVCVSCEPRGRQLINEDLNLGNLVSLFGRLQDLVTGEIIERDFRVLDLVNRALQVIEILERLNLAESAELAPALRQLRELAGLANKKQIARPLLITPPYYLRVAITDFNTADILRMMTLGRQAAAEAVQGRTWT